MHIVFILPGDIDLPTGGYRYDRAIIREWREAGCEVELVTLEGDYPFPTRNDKARDLELVEKIGKADIAIVDGLAGGAHPQLLEAVSRKMPVIALIHHPLCLETGLEEQTAKALEMSEAAGITHVSGIVTTSPQTAKTVASLFDTGGIPVEWVAPAVERNRLAQPNDQGPVKLLCVGSLIERKGHATLLLSLAKLKDLNWTLDCIGETEFHPEHFSKLEQLVRSSHLTDQVTFLGAVEQEQLENVYGAAHVFVLPSFYEGYGMVFAEAIARGIPVIGTTAGAIPQTVPEGCGILVEPGNVEQLTDALLTMISDFRQREIHRRTAIAASDSFPTWSQSAEKFSAFLEQFT